MSVSCPQSLQGHKYGWVFNEPVDPIKLCIHDYFKIIKHPMDLGTVKVARVCLNLRVSVGVQWVQAMMAAVLGAPRTWTLTPRVPPR